MTRERMSSGQVRRLLAACASALILAGAIDIAAADPAENAGAAAGDPAQVSSPPAARHTAAKPRHKKKLAEPAHRKQTTNKDGTKDDAAKPAAASSLARSKSSNPPPMFGPFSFGVETDPNVKRRSFSGEEADPDRDPNVVPQRKTVLPSFLGLSLKSPFSW